jgi:hypothetical protein
MRPAPRPSSELPSALYREQVFRARVLPPWYRPADAYRGPNTGQLLLGAALGFAFLIVVLASLSHRPIKWSPVDVYLVWPGRCVEGLSAAGACIMELNVSMPNDQRWEFLKSGESALVRQRVGGAALVATVRVESVSSDGLRVRVAATRFRTDQHRFVAGTAELGRRSHPQSMLAFLLELIKEQ